MDLTEAIKALMAHSNREEVVAALQKDGQPLYQLVFNKGHAVATAKLEAEKATVEARATQAEQERDAAKGTLAERERNTPDVAAIRTQYEQQIADLKEQHKGTLLKEKEARQAERLERTKAELRADLVSAGVDPDYADVLVEKRETLSRLTFRKDDGVLEILQAGKTIPLAVGDGESPVKLLVAELRGATPAKFISSNADGGSGSSSGNGGGGGATIYDKIRAERQPAAGAPERTAAPAPSTAAARMGLV
jgi:multidrug efflux pump subunit AcrA (membrane-fusion protein)